MPPQQLQNQLVATPNSNLPSTALMGNMNLMESNYEVFDPLNWMLDGLVDFPYSYSAVHSLEANGMG